MTLVFPVQGQCPCYRRLSGAHQEVGRMGEAEGRKSDKFRAARGRDPRHAERRNRDKRRKEDWRGRPREGASLSGSAGIPEEVGQARGPEEVFPGGS